MIVLIQAVVICIALVLIFSVFAGRQSHAAKAWKKLAFVALSVLMIVAVLFPEITNMAARVVGVGRGADLLLYVLTLSFIAYAVNSYMHRQKDKDALYRLARKVALLDAYEHYDIKRK